MAEGDTHDARDRVESANEEVEGVTDQFVVGERAAAYFGLDAVADEIVARVAPAIGDDFAHITGDVAHRIAHRVQIRFEIGSTSCRERVCQYVYLSVGDVS